jgi:hypothetical protein
VVVSSVLQAANSGATARFKLWAPKKGKTSVTIEF